MYKFITEKAIQLQQTISILLESGGFQLRILLTNREISLPLQFFLDNTLMTFRHASSSYSDEFQFKVQLPDANVHLTKRSLLSDTVQLYDLLGWLAPFIINAKILMQILWQAGLRSRIAKRNKG